MPNSHRKSQLPVPFMGFTLLELLVVLGLIVLIFSIGFPQVHRMYVHGELKAGIRQLQGELYRTRLEAMKSGKPYVFRYEIGTSHFEIVPKSVFDKLQEDQTGMGATAVGPELPGTANDPGFGDPFAVQTDSPSAEAVVSTSSGDVYGKSLHGSIVFAVTPPGGSGWSAPIFFYPNGRTSQTSLTIRTTGTYSFQQELNLRGLTGTASVEP